MERNFETIAVAILILLHWRFFRYYRCIVGALRVKHSLRPHSGTKPTLSFVPCSRRKWLLLKGMSVISSSRWGGWSLQDEDWETWIHKGLKTKHRWVEYEVLQNDGGGGHITWVDRTEFCNLNKIDRSSNWMDTYLYFDLLLETVSPSTVNF